jgi:hypothetical protein
MLVMSPDYSKIMTNIAAMYPMSLGGTTTSVGLSWAFRVLSPNWAIAAPAAGTTGGVTTNVFQAGAVSTQTGIAGLNLPLPYNYILTDPSGSRITMHKVVIFMTDGDNQWFTNAGGNTYTAYKTVDHTPLFDQTPAWTATSDVPGGKIPESLSRTATTLPTSLNNTTMTNRETSASTIWTNNAWALCDAMQADGVIIYTILLEFKTTDISSTISAGYQQHCATDSAAGTHFFELTGSQVSELNNVFTSIGNSLSELRLAQ